MVGANTAPNVARGATPDLAMVAAVRARLSGQSHRFVTVSGRGLGVDMAALADLIAEIVTEYTDHVIAERDALAEDLAWELNATRTGATAATGAAGGGA